MKILLEKFSLESNKVDSIKRIVLLTDLHYTDETEEEFNNGIILEIRKISPDYICLVGDFFSGFGKYNFKSIKAMNHIKDLLHRLKRIAPVILSLGNHDLSVSNEMELRQEFKKLRENNIYPLDNESLELSDIYFSGFYPRRKSYAISKLPTRKVRMIIEDWHKANLTAKKGKFSILCHHLPDTILDKRVQKEAQDIYSYDLVLSGHAHNGWLSPQEEIKKNKRIDYLISKLPSDDKEKFEILKQKLEAKKYYGFCESILNFPPFLRKFSRGMHDVNGTKLIISRGITSGGRLVVGPKAIMNIKEGYSYITEIEIRPIEKQKTK